MLEENINLIKEDFLFEISLSFDIKRNTSFNYFIEKLINNS